MNIGDVYLEDVLDELRRKGLEVECEKEGRFPGVKVAFFSLKSVDTYRKRIEAWTILNEAATTYQCIPIRRDDGSGLSLDMRVVLVTENFFSVIFKEMQIDIDALRKDYWFLQGQEDVTFIKNEFDKAVISLKTLEGYICTKDFDKSFQQRRAYLSGLNKLFSAYNSWCRAQVEVGLTAGFMHGLNEKLVFALKDF